MNKTNSKFTVTVGIAAYNEGLNIANLLRSIKRQKQHNFVLEKVYVYSDGSTDDTEEKVLSFAQSMPQVKLVSDGKRVGKTKRLNKMFKMNKSNIFVYFDGDLILENSETLSNMIGWFKDGSVTLVGANKLPLKERTLTERLINTWFLLWYEIRTRFDGGHNVYNFSSCAFAVRDSLAKQLDCPTGDFSFNKYLFFKSTENGFGCRFAESAAVLFRSPDNIKGHLKQLSRFTSVNRKIADYFGDWTYEMYKIPRLQVLQGFLVALLKEPLWLLPAVAFHIIVRLIPPQTDPLIREGMWEIASSTKRVI